MASRGPDDFSVFSRDNLTILHSRLAVIGADDPVSRQPIEVDGDFLFCNGFISNYKEILASENIGHIGADCLTVIEVYRRFGVDGFALLRGQFAAALLDAARGRIVLARDASGITPLYYAEADGKLLFASQASWIRFLLEGTNSFAADRLDNEAHDEWSACGYVAGPDTLLSGIREVPAGGVLQFDLNGRLVESAVTRLPPTPSSGSGDTARLTRDLLQQAVRRNLNADIPPCLLFSGGLDSTLLLHSIVAEGIRPRLVALEYSDGENRSELEHAAKVARHYGCPLEVIGFEPPLDAEMEQLFRGRVDWPLDGGSLLPKVALANHLMAQDCKVVLGGSGADELFGGYRRHQARLAMYEAGTIGDIEAEREYYRSWVGKFGESAKAFDVFLRQESSELYADPAFVYDLMELSQFHNPRLDSCFANVGLEYRPIFQDQDLVSLAASLPLDLKSKVGTPKKLLRDAFNHEIPAEFINVPKSPLRFGRMGPTPSWRGVVFNSWAAARNVVMAAR